MNKLSSERYGLYKGILERTKNSPIKTIEWEGNYYHCKLEYLLPHGECHYARIFSRLIYLKECLGVIKPGDTLLETTSGSGGRAAAAVATALGYTIKIMLPAGGEKAREEAIKKAGGELILTPARDYVNAFPEYVASYIRNNPRVKYLNHSMGNLLGRGRDINHAAIDAFRPFIYEVLSAGIIPDIVFSPLGNGTTTFALATTFRDLFPETIVIGIESVLSAYVYRKFYGNKYKSLFGVNPEVFSRNDLPGSTPSHTSFTMPAIEAVATPKILHSVRLVTSKYADNLFTTMTGYTPEERSKWVVRWDTPPLLRPIKDFGRTGRAAFMCAMATANEGRLSGKHFLIPVFDAAWHYDS